MLPDEPIIKMVLNVTPYISLPSLSLMFPCCRLTYENYLS